MYHELIKYVVSQIAIVTSYFIIVNLILRSKMTGESTTKSQNLILFTMTLMVTFCVVFLDYYYFQTTYPFYTSYILIVGIFIVSVLYLDHQVHYALFFMLFIFHLYQVSIGYDFLKYIFLYICAIFASYFIARNWNKGLFIAFMSSIYVLIEVFIIITDHQFILIYFLLQILFGLYIYLVFAFYQIYTKRYKMYYDYSHRDFLTNLYNDRYLVNYYNDIIKDKVLDECGPYSYIFIDLNGLKKINDAFGHHHGDRVLKRLSIHLEEIYQDGIIFRKSGDEFVVLYEGHALKAKSLSEQLLKQLSEAIITIEDQIISISVSIGIVELNKTNIDQNIFVQVDQAMYEAKLMHDQRIIICK